MKWIKKGLIYCPKGNFNWNISHAQIPLAYIVDNETIRVYYSTRDVHNRSYLSYVELETEDPKKIKYVHNLPILELGKIGEFDDSGVMPSCIIEQNKQIYLYYTGWNVGVNVHYRLAIGLAISNDNGMTFSKFSNGPILDRSIYDPCLSASPSVLFENGIWRMWYISGTKWELINNEPEPFYHIKYAESIDGITWNRNGLVCLDYDSFTEGISRPCIIRDKNTYFLFYSYRNNFNYRTNKESTYRIGYAKSDDGLTWERDDKKIGLTFSENGWDSQMLAYPNVIVWNNRKYMFYNGNGFGKTGFGYAVLEE